MGDYSTIGRIELNIILFIIGTVALISWLPGLIIGSILLATKPKRRAPPST